MFRKNDQKKMSVCVQYRFRLLLPNIVHPCLVECKRTHASGRPSVTRREHEEALRNSTFKHFTDKGVESKKLGQLWMELQLHSLSQNSGSQTLMDLNHFFQIDVARHHTLVC